jgi:RNA polymerase sigma factor (sigma-70 family)
MSSADRRIEVFAGIDHQELDRHVRAFARRFVRSGIPVDDCAQAVWTHILIDLSRLPIDGDLQQVLAWLRTVVHNVAQTLARDETRHDAEPIEAASLLPCLKDGPEIVCERSETVELFALAVGELQASISEEEFRLFQSRVLGKKTWLGIAAEFDLTVDQVRYRYDRIHNDLRRRLQSRGLE